jgi:hypothetical protein
LTAPVLLSPSGTVPSENELYEIEVLAGEVVDSTRSELEPAPAERFPVRTGQLGVQTAVAAATGFVAGAAAMVLLRRYGQARLERAGAVPALEPPRVGQARTYVVHVRPLG